VNLKNPKDITMNAISESPNLGDLLKYEEDCLNYSREVATVAAGQNLLLGSVVARETLTGKLKALDPAATDGTETPVGILLGNVDASLIDVDDAQPPCGSRLQRCDLAGRNSPSTKGHCDGIPGSHRHSDSPVGLISIF
jgi:hypothetical protein